MSEQAGDHVQGPQSGNDQPAYRVLARKYRPQIFADLIGQDAMVRTLANAFDSGRIAQAYMLTGVRGVGKTTTARLIARALNYTGSDGPSIDMPELGEHCQAIMESRHVDVLEMDAASRTGIDDVREIIESARYKPIAAPYKIYIIDEVHMLSKAAFNALLKTLEEPPEHVKFIFATTEIRKVPVTVLSRCQRFDLRRIETTRLMEHFSTVAQAEGFSIAEQAVRMIARAAEGSVRDGLSLLDQAMAYGGQEIQPQDVQAMLGLADREQVIGVFESVMAGDAGSALDNLDNQFAHGADAQTVLADLADFIHWVTRLKIAPQSADEAARTEAERTRGAAFAGKLAMPALTRAWQIVLKGMNEVAQSHDARMTAEMVLIRLAYAADLPSPADLVRKLTDGAGTPAGPASPARASAGSPAASPSAAGGAPSGSADAVHLAPRMSAATAPQLAHDSHDTSAPPAPSDRQLSDFAAIVDLTGKHRDIKLKSQLERYVRPVRVAPGQVEIALEQGAPHGLPGELGRKLEAWTGQRWMVLVSREAGEEPIAEQKKRQKDSLFRSAREHPVVSQVLETFPGARITNVRDLSGPAPLPGDDDCDNA